MAERVRSQPQILRGLSDTVHSLIDPEYQLKKHRNILFDNVRRRLHNIPPGQLVLIALRADCPNNYYSSLTSTASNIGIWREPTTIIASPTPDEGFCVTQYSILTNYRYPIMTISTVNADKSGNSHVSVRKARAELQIPLATIAEMPWEQTDFDRYPSLDKQEEIYQQMVQMITRHPYPCG